jgi:3-phenylpropionate/cinnamic acid dioxygenase small subunit
MIDLATRIAVEDFYYLEAELLDDRRWEDWLALLGPEIEYTAPIRVTRRSPHNDIIDDLGHFDDTLSSLTLRVKRLRTDVAWAEDPPSHTRRLVTNVRVTDAGESALSVRTNLMLYRSRGDLGAHDLIVGERHDVLRRAGDGFLISRRRTVLDQSSLGTKNLAVFL